jgi:hypothetical protein
LRRALYPSTFSLTAAAIAVTSLLSGAALAAEPIGYLDAASCDGFLGWAQDPDEPEKAIAVHIYIGGPAGTPGVPAFATTANVHRDDLCGAIGSCAHGFLAPTPLSLHDGSARDTYAYGIDSAGGVNPVLGASPKPLACAPAVAPGVRRRVDGVPAFDAWRFSSFWDLLPLGAAEADALPDGPALPEAPDLVLADDGNATVWLVDGGVRRAVSAAAAAAWRFDLSAVATRPAAEVQALVEGTPVRPRPVLFVRGALYLADDPQPEVPGSPSASASSSGGAGGAGSSSSAGGGGDAPSPGDAGADASCAVRAPLPGRSMTAIAALVFGGALLSAGRRRRPGRSRSA